MVTDCWHLHLEITKLVVFFVPTKPTVNMFQKGFLMNAFTYLLVLNLCVRVHTMDTNVKTRTKTEK